MVEPDDDGLLSGVERLRQGVGASGGRLPFVDHFPFRFSEVAEGRVSMTCELDDLLRSAWELSPLSVIGACADSALGGVVGSMLDRRRMSISLQLRVDARRPASPGLRGFAAHARVVDIDDDVALAVCDVIDDDGTVLAVGTLRSAIARVRPSAATPPVAVPDHDAEVRTGATGTDDDLTSAVLRYVQARATDEDATSLALEVTPPATMANSISMIHGGAVCLLAGLSGAVTARRRLAGRPGRELGLDIAYFAPNRVEVASTFRGHLVQETSRVATIAGEVLDGGSQRTTAYRQLWQLAR